MGGGTSRMEKMISRHTQSPAGKAKAASRNVDRALKELSGKLQSRGLSLGSEEAEIRLQSVLSQDNSRPGAAPPPLQVSEVVRLTAAASQKYNTCELDRQENLQPGDPAEILQISGSRCLVLGPGRPDARTVEYWYNKSELERLPPGWSVMGRAERQAGVGDSEHKTIGGYDWAGAGHRHGVSVQVDRLTATKMRDFTAPVWSREREEIRELAIAEEKVEMAHNYMASKKFQLALQCLADALAYHPDKAMCHSQRGSCFVFIGELKLALAEYEQACAIDPGEGSYWRGSGMACFYLGNFLDAEDRLHRAVSLGYKEAVQDLQDVSARNAGKEQELQNRIVETREKTNETGVKADWQIVETEGETPSTAENTNRAKEAEANAAEKQHSRLREAVQQSELMVDEAELQVMQLRAEREQHSEEFEQAQQRLMEAKALLQQQKLDATQAKSNAQTTRVAAQKARVKEAKRIAEAKEVQDIAQRKRSQAEEVKTRHDSLEARQAPLEEGDKASLRPNSSVNSGNGARASLEPGDVGLVVMVSDDRTRVRVQGPTVRGKSGHCSWYAQSELERPAAAGMLDPQLPSSLDSRYLAHMKAIDREPPLADYYDNLGASPPTHSREKTDAQTADKPGTIATSTENQNQLALPAGWEQQTTHDGVTYFVDHNSQQRHRRLPGSVRAEVYVAEELLQLALPANDAEAGTGPTDVGKAFNTFFTEGLALAVVNPTQFDIRRQSECHASRAGLHLELGLGTHSAANAAAEKEKLKWTDYLQAQDKLRAQRRNVEQFHRLGNASITEVIKAQGARKDAHRRQRRMDDRVQRSTEMKATTAAHEYAARERSLHKQHAEIASRNTNTPVHEASSTGDIERLVQLISAKPSTLNVPGEYGQTPLILAAAESKSAALQLLLDMGAAVDSRDDDGMTALMWACASKAVDCVERLLKASALVTLTDTNGNSATDWAVSPTAAGSNIVEKRRQARKISKRRWGKALAPSSTQSGANWKTGYAAHTGEGWSLATYCAPVKPRAAIHPSSGMLRDTDFSIYRMAQPDFRRYPGTGYAVSSTMGARSSLLGSHLLPYVNGRQWDRLDRFEGPLKDAKRVEAVLKGHSAEDVLHDLQWHDMSQTLENGGATAVLGITSALTQCQSALGYAVRVIAAAERSAVVELRNRIRDLLRVFCGSRAEAACGMIAALIERDGQGDPIEAPRAAICSLEIDGDPRQRRQAAEEPRSSLDEPQITRRILARMIVAASNIPGRAACNDTSPLALEEDRTGRVASLAEETKDLARDHLRQCKNASAEAAQEAADAAEAASLAKKLQFDLTLELSAKSEQLKSIWHRVQEGTQSKEQADKFETMVDEINMRLTATKIEASERAQDAVAAQSLYEEKILIVSVAQDQMAAAEKFAIEQRALADCAQKERVAAARAEWRDQWKSLDLETGKTLCESLGLSTLGSAEELHDRLASSSVMIVVTALVERLEILLVHLFDAEGLRAFLGRQLGTEVFHDLYLRLRYVHRALLVTDVNPITTLNRLQDCFGRMFGPVELIHILPSDDHSTISQAIPWAAICVFQSAVSAELADQKGTVILDDRGIRFSMQESAAVKEQVKEKLKSFQEISVNSSVILDLLEYLVEIDSEDDEAPTRTVDVSEQITNKSSPDEQGQALVPESGQSSHAKADDSKDTRGISNCKPQQEILDMLDHATGLVVQLSEDLQNRKRLRNQQWGLTESGNKVKERTLPGIDTPIGKKLYNVVVGCVRGAKMVSAADLERNFDESELVSMLGLPSAKSAKDQHELAIWLLPQAKKYWSELADALAVKGASSSGGAKSAAWRKARSSLVVGSALGRSSPAKEMSLRSAAGKGMLKQIKLMLKDGVDLDKKNKLGWSAYQYAVRHGHPHVATLLESAGCNVEDVPEMHTVEKAAATLYRVLHRSVIREDILITSADVGFVHPQELVYIVKLHIDAEGNKRGQIDRGWVTVSAGRSSDARTSGVVRLLPAAD